MTVQAVADATGKVLVGIDVGGTKALAVAVRDGRTVWTESRPTGRDLGPTACIELVGELVDAASQHGPVHAVGLGIPGLVEPTGRTVRSSVILDGWNDVPVAELVTRRTGRPCRVDNDVNNAARAEVDTRHQAGTPAHDLLFIAVGTGIGGAVVLGGRVWPGAAGAAGEVGHMSVPGVTGTCDCGRVGCVAVAAGGRSIEDQLGIRTGTLGTGPMSEAGAAAVDAGARRLGEAVANAMNLLNLPLVVLGGGVALRPGFAATVEKVFRTAAMPEVAAACRVEVASAGYDAGAVGAALLAADA